MRKGHQNPPVQKTLSQTTRKSTKKGTCTPVEELTVIPFQNVSNFCRDIKAGTSSDLLLSGRRVLLEQAVEELSSDTTRKSERLLEKKRPAICLEQTSKQDPIQTAKKPKLDSDPEVKVDTPEMYNNFPYHRRSYSNSYNASAEHYGRGVDRHDTPYRITGEIIHCPVSGRRYESEWNTRSQYSNSRYYPNHSHRREYGVPPVGQPDHSSTTWHNDDYSTSPNYMRFHDDERQVRTRSQRSTCTSEWKPVQSKSDTSTYVNPNKQKHYDRSLRSSTSSTSNSAMPKKTVNPSRTERGTTCEGRTRSSSTESRQNATLQKGDSRNACLKKESKVTCNAEQISNPVYAISASQGKPLKSQTCGKSTQREEIGQKIPVVQSCAITESKYKNPSVNQALNRSLPEASETQPKCRKRDFSGEPCGKPVMESSIKVDKIQQKTLVSSVVQKQKQGANNNPELKFNIESSCTNQTNPQRTNRKEQQKATSSTAQIINQNTVTKECDGRNIDQSKSILSTPKNTKDHQSLISSSPLKVVQNSGLKANRSDIKEQQKASTSQKLNQNTGPKNNCSNNKQQNIYSMPQQLPAQQKTLDNFQQSSSTPQKVNQNTSKNVVGKPQTNTSFSSSTPKKADQMLSPQSLGFNSSVNQHKEQILIPEKAILNTGPNRNVCNIQKPKNLTAPQAQKVIQNPAPNSSVSNKANQQKVIQNPAPNSSLSNKAYQQTSTMLSQQKVMQNPAPNSSVNNKAYQQTSTMLSQQKVIQNPAPNSSVNNKANQQTSMILNQQKVMQNPAPNSSVSNKANQQTPTKLNQKKVIQNPASNSSVSNKANQQTPTKLNQQKVIPNPASNSSVSNKTNQQTPTKLNQQKVIQNPAPNSILSNKANQQTPTKLNQQKVIQNPAPNSSVSNKTNQQTPTKLNQQKVIQNPAPNSILSNKANQQTPTKLNQQKVIQNPASNSILSNKVNQQTPTKLNQQKVIQNPCPNSILSNKANQQTPTKLNQQKVIQNPASNSSVSNKANQQTPTKLNQQKVIQNPAPNSILSNKANQQTPTKLNQQKVIQNPASNSIVSNKVNQQTPTKLNQQKVIQIPAPNSILSNKANQQTPAKLNQQKVIQNPAPNSILSNKANQQTPTKLNQQKVIPNPASNSSVSNKANQQVNQQKVIQNPAPNSILSNKAKQQTPTKLNQQKVIQNPASNSIVSNKVNQQTPTKLNQQKVIQIPAPNSILSNKANQQTPAKLNQQKVIQNPAPNSILSNKANQQTPTKLNQQKVIPNPASNSSVSNKANQQVNQQKVIQNPAPNSILSNKAKQQTPTIKSTGPVSQVKSFANENKTLSQPQNPITEKTDPPKIAGGQRCESPYEKERHLSSSKDGKYRRWSESKDDYSREKPESSGLRERHTSQDVNDRARHRSDSCDRFYKDKSGYKDRFNRERSESRDRRDRYNSRFAHERDRHSSGHSHTFHRQNSEPSDRRDSCSSWSVYDRDRRWSGSNDRLYSQRSEASNHRKRQGSGYSRERDRHRSGSPVSKSNYKSGFDDRGDQKETPRSSHTSVSDRSCSNANREGHASGPSYEMSGHKGKSVDNRKSTTSEFSDTNGRCNSGSNSYPDQHKPSSSDQREKTAPDDTEIKDKNSTGSGKDKQLLDSSDWKQTLEYEPVSPSEKSSDISVEETTTKNDILLAVPAVTNSRHEGEVKLAEEKVEMSRSLQVDNASSDSKVTSLEIQTDPKLMACSVSIADCLKTSFVPNRDLMVNLACDIRTTSQTKTVDLVASEVPDICKDKDKSHDFKESDRVEVKESSSSPMKSDLDISDSGSDSELEDVPLFVKIKKASSCSVPSTEPRPVIDDLSDDPDTSWPATSMVTKTSQPDNSNRYMLSLDRLLTERKERKVKDEELETMQEECNEVIKQGGYFQINFDNKQETVGELLPEHHQKLRCLSVSEQKIVEIHPGVEVFTPNSYQRLFTDTLSLQTCGFMPGSSYIDKYLASLQPDAVTDLLTSHLLSMTFGKVSCPEALLSWLIYIMSVHGSRLVVDGIRQDLAEIIVHQQELEKLSVTWAPSLQIILRILLNYGATVSSLCADQTLLGLTDDEIRVLNTPLEVNNGEHPLPEPQRVNNRGMNRENFRQVLQIIAIGLRGRPNYSKSQLLALSVILCNVALEKNFNNLFLHHEIQVCLATLLELYNDNEWTTQASLLCHRLSNLTDHHHNRFYLVQLFPFTVRGQYIQRRLSYLILCDILSVERHCQDLHLLKIEHLHCMVDKLRELIHSELYLLSSVIMLLDRCVGNEKLKSSEKSDLWTLTDSIRNLTGGIRDNICMLDRTKVKDMMVRLTSLWTLMIQSMNSSQPTLFTWRQGAAPVKMRVETVASQDTESESSEGEMEAEEEQTYGRTKRQELISERLNLQSSNEDNSVMSQEVELSSSNTLSKNGDCGNTEDMESLQRLLNTDEDILPEI